MNVGCNGLRITKQTWVWTPNPLQLIQTNPITTFQTLPKVAGIFSLGHKTYSNRSPKLPLQFSTDYCSFHASLHYI